MSHRKNRGIAYRPYAFAKQGVAMFSSVLRSQRAVEVNIAIMRTFVQLRRLMDSNLDLARRIEATTDRAPLDVLVQTRTPTAALCRGSLTPDVQESGRSALHR